jgi:hypothetical protein
MADVCALSVSVRARVRQGTRHHRCVAPSRMVDLRDMPREVQEIAFAKGVIPYIPADQG